jgi:hypothetical protein
LLIEKAEELCPAKYQALALILEGKLREEVADRPSGLGGNLWVATSWAMGLTERARISCRLLKNGVF